MIGFSHSVVYRVIAMAALLVVLGVVSAIPVQAASTVDTFTFESAEQEQRYRGLIAEIRCPKCQNVNIAGSDAPIAKDLRVTVHRLLGDGMSDAEILAFLQARYGDFVLYDPPIRGNTLLLWLLPLIGFFGALLVVVRLARRQPSAGDAQALSDDDAQRLDELLAATAEAPQRSAGQAGRSPVGQAGRSPVGDSS